MQSSHCSVIILVLTGCSSGVESAVWLLPLLPLLAGIMDYAENSCTQFHLWRLPKHDVGVAWVGTICTFIKQVVVNSSMLLTLVAWLIGLFKPHKASAE